MKNLFRQFFIPTLENGTLPYALHPAAFSVYMIFAATLFVGPAYMNRLHLANLSSPYRSYSIVELVNASRSSLGLPMLKESTTLEQVALAKARDIFEKQYFSHISPDSKTPWDFLKSYNYVYSAAGENLAIDFISPEDAHRGLMASPTHRANILNKLYTEIGVAVYEGTFEDRQSIVVVQYFGAPRSVRPVAIAEPKKGCCMNSKTEPKNAVVPVAALNNPTSTPSTTPADQQATPQLMVEEIAGLFPAMVSELRKESFPYVPVASLFVTSAILLSLSFILTRREIISSEVALRAFIFVLIFGYLALTGGKVKYLPTVSPAAFSSVVR
jgi:hypothetical protein